MNTRQVRCLHCRSVTANVGTSVCDVCGASAPQTRPSRELRRAVKPRPVTSSSLDSKAIGASGMSVGDFMRALLAHAAGGRSVRDLLAILTLDGPLVVNGRPAKLQQIKQAAWQLHHEGLASFDGDILRP